MAIGLLPQDTVERGAADAQRAGRVNFVATQRFQYSAGVTVLHLRHGERPFIFEALERHFLPKHLGEIAHIDGIVLRHHAGVAEYIFQLAYISGPVIAGKQRLGSPGEGREAVCYTLWRNAPENVAPREADLPFCRPTEGA